VKARPVHKGNAEKIGTYFVCCCLQHHAKIQHVFGNAIPAAQPAIALAPSMRSVRLPNRPGGNAMNPRAGILQIRAVLPFFAQHFVQLKSNHSDDFAKCPHINAADSDHSGNALR